MGKSEILAQQVRVMQIIKSALIMGVVSFAVFVVFGSQRAQDIDPQIVWLLAGFGGLMIFLRILVPPLIARTFLQQIAAGTWQPKSARVRLPGSDEGKLAAVYQTQMMIGSGLLEAGAFANLFACMTRGHIVSWVFSGILLLGLIIDFPTLSSVKRWIDSKLVWINDERRLARRS